MNVPPTKSYGWKCPKVPSWYKPETFGLQHATISKMRCVQAQVRCQLIPQEANKCFDELIFAPSNGKISSHGDFANLLDSSGFRGMLHSHFDSVMLTTRFLESCV